GSGGMAIARPWLPSRAVEKPPGEQELRVITDTMPVAAVRCDRDSRFLWVNPTYAKWAGRAARDIIGLRIIDIMGSRAMREIQPFVDRIVAGEQVAYERLVELPGLGRRWVKWAYTPTHDAAGRVDGWVATGLDIHAAKEADPRKDEFLATPALEAARPYINAAGHHLSVLLPSERAVIDADPARLAQVFSTLLKNAARHMQARGSINLTASVESGAVLVHIEDTGVGLNPGAEPGVGLTLVRGILALHQGGVEIRAADSGEGAEAVVRLPLAGPGSLPDRKPARTEAVEAP